MRKWNFDGSDSEADKGIAHTAPVWHRPTNADGKREGHTVYAKTREECEKLLENMIEEVRNRIKAEKEQQKNGTETAS